MYIEKTLQNLELQLFVNNVAQETKKIKKPSFFLEI